MRVPVLLVRDEAWVVAGRSAEDAVDVSGDRDFAGTFLGEEVDATVTVGVRRAKDARLEAEDAIDVDPPAALVRWWSERFLRKKRRYAPPGLRFGQWGRSVAP